MTGGPAQGTTAFKLDDASVFNDLKGRCGFTIAEAADTKTPLFQLNLKSLPIVTKGKQDDIEYEVVVEATAKVGSQDSKSYTDVDAQLQKITANSLGVPVSQAAIDKFIKPLANSMLSQGRGRSSGSSVPSSTLLRLYREEGQYKGIFCGVGLGLGSRSTLGGEQTEIEYKDPLPGALNPKAALSTYESELGEGKTFKTAVVVKKAGKEWMREGSEVPVTLTVKKISPDLTKLMGLPKDLNVPTIKADVAYEFVASGPEGVLISKFGMTKRMVFFVDSERKTFAAIVTESDKQGPDKSTLPPIVLIPQE
ncbi:MAG: hypothetical protein NTV34_08275 [Proteobacteria bacterium]|nr:hypothetical protein [Pseudomonadota bacterium]